MGYSQRVTPQANLHVFLSWAASSCHGFTPWGKRSHEKMLSLFAHEASSDQYHVPSFNQCWSVLMGVLVCLGLIHCSSFLFTSFQHAPSQPTYPAPQILFHPLHPTPSARTRIAALRTGVTVVNVVSALMVFVLCMDCCSLACPRHCVLLLVPFASFQPLVACPHIHGGSSSLGASLGCGQQRDAVRVPSIPS